MQPAWAVIRVSISGSEMVEIDKYHDSFFTIVPAGCVFERGGGAPLPDPAVEVFLHQEMISLLTGHLGYHQIRVLEVFSGHDAKKFLKK